jgi:hypothetical protein
MKTRILIGLLIIVALTVFVGCPGSNGGGPDPEEDKSLVRFAWIDPASHTNLYISVSTTKFMVNSIITPPPIITPNVEPDPYYVVIDSGSYYLVYSSLPNSFSDDGSSTDKFIFEKDKYYTVTLNVDTITAAEDL